MITATARLLGTITATAVIFSTQTGSCAAATVEVNGNLFDTVASGGTLDVPVEYANGTPVGTIVAGVVEIPNPIVCADATVENTDLSYLTTVASGGTLVLPDTTYNFYVNNILKDTQTIPSLKNETFEIYFV